MEGEKWDPETSDPHEHWVEVEEFPGYSVSDRGRVRNNHSGRILVLTQNQYGVVKVGMSKEGKQHARSVALLVAQHHLEPPPDNSVFDTPINLDGNRFNNRSENLMWRPRWFAVKYQQQFTKEGVRKGFKTPVQAMGTGIIYKDSMEAATKLGILAEDTVKSVMHSVYVFPTFQMFKLMDEPPE